MNKQYNPKKALKKEKEKARMDYALLTGNK
jgi:hypothetical protein